MNVKSCAHIVARRHVGRSAYPLSYTVAVVAAVFLSRPAGADVYLSGDGNIIDPLVGMPATDTGNQQFFRNVLAGGTRVALLQNTYPGCCESFDERLSEFYNSLPGVNATTIVGTVDAAALTEVDLFVSAIPDDAFTPAEITALSGLLSSGGSIFFLGENGTLATYNQRINDALTALGTPLSIVNADIDAGFHTVGAAHIIADASTVGVGSFTYAAPSTVAAVSGGKYLVYTQGNLPLVAVARVVPEPGAAALFMLAGIMTLSLKPRNR